MIKLNFCSFEIKSFGVITIASLENAVVFLNTNKNSLVDYANTLNAELIENYENNAEAVTELKDYFEGKRKEFSVKTAFLSGTEFQKKVWKELTNINFGTTSTYKDIASNIKHTNAFRAVGTANSKNPIPIIVPCHRIINSNGGLSGFALGIKKKKYLLELEKAL